jgi:hypothetical protein
MPRQPHWFDPAHAGEFAGDLLQAAIEVTKMSPKPEPPKPKPKPDTKESRP